MTKGLSFLESCMEWPGFNLLGLKKMMSVSLSVQISLWLMSEA